MSGKSNSRSCELSESESFSSSNEAKKEKKKLPINKKKTKIITNQMATNRAQQFRKDGIIAEKNLLKCKFCNYKTMEFKKSSITSHIKSKCHQKNQKGNEGISTINTEESINRIDQVKQINKDLIKAFTEANIPLHKIDHPSIRNFVSKYVKFGGNIYKSCLLYTSPSPRDRTRSRMPSSA